MMKIIMTRLHNKMGDDFFVDYLVIYIEKKILENFIINSIIDEFSSMKQRRVHERNLWRGPPQLFDKISFIS